MNDIRVSDNRVNAATDDEEKTNEERSCSSRPNVIHLRYVWNIANFGSISDTRSTPIFGSKYCSFILCRMDMLFDRPAVYIYPQVVSNAAENRYKFRCTIQNGEGRVIHSLARDELYPVQTKFDTMDNLLYSRLVFKSPVSCVSLSLHCDIHVLTGIVHIIHSPLTGKRESEKNVEEHEIDGESFEIIDLSNGKEIKEINGESFEIIDLSKCLDSGLSRDVTLVAKGKEFKELDGESFEIIDLGKLLDSGHNSDVTLVANGKEFRVHQGLLALRSVVFAAMFQQKDSRQRVVIDDFDHNVIREMLYFIYTGKSPNIDTMTLALLAAADKFALTTLKTMCESMLDLDLNVSSAVRTLILADRQGAKTLKSRTMDIIKANISTISKTQEWADLYSNHAHLIIELISLSNS